MKKTFVNFLLCLFFTAFAVSCDKEKEEEPAGGSLSESSLYGSWECTEGAVISSLEGTMDYFQFLPDGILREVFIVPESYGPLANTQIGSGTWELSGNDIIIEIDGMTKIWQNVKVTSTSMQFTYLNGVTKFKKIPDFVVDKYFD